MITEVMAAAVAMVTVTVTKENTGEMIVAGITDTDIETCIMVEDMHAVR